MCVLIYSFTDPYGSFDLLYFCSAGPEITRMWGLCDPSLRLNLIDGIKSRTRAEGGVWCGSWRSWEWGEGKSLGFSHSFTHSLVTSPSPSSPPYWWTGPPHSAPGYIYRDVTLVRIPPSVAQQSGTRVIFTDRRARLPIHVPPLQMRDMTVYWWSHVANKTAQQK